MHKSKKYTEHTCVHDGLTKGFKHKFLLVSGYISDVVSDDGVKFSRSILIISTGV